MATKLTPATSTQARQEASLKQLQAYQAAVSQLIAQQPEAAKTLMDLLHDEVQRAFRDHPLPIPLDAVSVEEHIRFVGPTRSTRLEPLHIPAHPLSRLFHDKPWGGEHYEAPNRVYRYYAKTTYHEKNSEAPNGQHTVHRRTGSNSAFERFIDDLIQRPDRCYQQKLDDFWREPHSAGSPLTRTQWLASQLQTVVQAEATLRAEDNTLDRQGQTLIDQVIKLPTHLKRAHLNIEKRPTVFSICLVAADGKADITLSHAFVVSSKSCETPVDATSDVGAAVLFTPHRGLDSFTSLHALNQSLSAQFSETQPDSGLLTCIAWQDQARAQAHQKAPLAFHYREINAALFEDRAHSLLALQKQDIAYGWSQLSRYGIEGKQVYELFNRVANIGALLDVSELLIQRGRRYIEANLPGWYRALDSVDKQALDRLIGDELISHKALVSQLQRVTIPPLQVYARDELIKQLATNYPGQVIDPDKVTVEITTCLNPASLGGGIGSDAVPGAPAPANPPHYTQTLSLTELALKNSTPWDFSFYSLFIGERTSMSAFITAANDQTLELDENALTSLVNTVDIAKGYDSLLQKQLLENAVPLRTAWTAAQKAHLMTAALVAKLEPGCLLEDREHRGYQWISTLIAQGRTTVGGHNIVASALLVANSASTRNGHELNEIFMISVERGQSVPNVILYTPDAPGAQPFKEFADLSAMQQFLQQQWASSAEWRRYFMQRMSLSGQATVTENKLSGTRLLSDLVVNSQARLRNPFDTVHTFVIKAPLLDALYLQRVHTLRSNADHVSTSNAEVSQQSLWNKITFGVDLALNLLSLLPITTAFNSVRRVSRLFLLLKQVSKSKSAAKRLWAITGAHGVPRPTPNLRPLATLKPAVDLSGLEVKINPQDLTQVRVNLYQSKAHTQQYALIDNQHYLCDVAQGQRFIYPPGTGAKVLRYPLVFDEASHLWIAQPMPRLRGGMLPVEQGPFETSYQDYELPLADLHALPDFNLAGPGSFSLESLVPSLSPDVQTAVLHLFAVQTRLRRHARQFFRSFSPPARPLALPPPDATFEQLFSELFRQHNGLIVGEAHHLDVARRFLIENMATLKRQGVDTLYLELLITDLHQSALDTINASPTLAMPTLLSDRLNAADVAYANTTPYNFTRLITEARAQGVRICALDGAASSQLAPNDLIPTGTAPSLADQLDRVTVFNFFAYKRIIHDQLVHGPHHWLALVGEGHSSTFQDISGLDSLTGASSIRMGGRIQGLPAQIRPDPGVLMPSPLSNHEMSFKSDVLVQLPDQANGHPIDRRVHRPNQFTFVRPSARQIDVHYMNTQHQRLKTSVQTDTAGVYVEHTGFGQVSHRRFVTLKALADALTHELQMVEV